MRVFWTLSGGLAALFSVLLLSGCGGGSSNTQPPPNPVQVSVTLSGSGTVTSSPAGVNCGTTCSQSFPEGTQVTLNATPAAGFSFGGWSGACTGTGACVLPTSGAQSVTASFMGSGALQVTVTLAGAGTGTVTSTPTGINCGTNCTNTFSPGTQVTLNATPAAGFSFSGWSGACAGTGTCTLPTSGPQSVTASFGASMQSINHIIFMAQENRGFDHYFGHLNAYRTAPPYNLPADVNGTPLDASNPSFDGTTIVTPFLMTSVCVENQSPSWNESHTDYNRNNPVSSVATMDGFVYISAKDAPSNGGFDLEGTRAMGYYDQTALPYYYFMATNFAMSDSWFAPVLTRTQPNRMYMMAATSAGHVYPLPSGSPGLPNKTIFELLQDNGISWKVYVTDPNPNPIDGTLFNMFTFSRQNLQNIVPATQFLIDAANGTLPAVAMIDPGYSSGRDEHPAAITPGGSVEKGSAYVSSLINGLMQSPSWSDSAFILTWDEPGGFYDHVAPVPTVSPDGIRPIDLAGPPSQDICYQDTTDPTCDFIYTGFRVGMIMVSPFANKNSVSHIARDHTSILKLIEQRFNLGSLTARDAVQPNMDEFFDFVNAPWKTPPSPPIQQTTGACYIDHLP
jgi:phospholipase C